MQSRGVVVFVVFVIGLLGCGPSLQQVIQAEVRSAINEVDRAWDRGLYPNRVSRAKEMQSRVEAVYARHGVRIDPFEQAFMSYIVAVSARMDRAEISYEEGKFLVDKMRAEMDLEKQRLRLQSEALQLQRDALLLQWLSTYQQRSRDPIRCTVISPPWPGGIGSVTCD